MSINSPQNELNAKMSWKFLGSGIGDKTFYLPSVWDELCVKINSIIDASVHFIYHLDRAGMYTVLENFRQGSYYNSTYYSECNLLVSTTQFRFGSLFINGQNDANAEIYAYIR